MNIFLFNPYTNKLQLRHAVRALLWNMTWKEIQADMRQLKDLVAKMQKYLGE